MSDRPVKIAIIFHSGYGHTKVITDHVAKGVEAAGGIELSVIDAESAAKDLDQFDGVDAMIFGSPTYMGGPSAPWKAFADATSKKWMAKSWTDKLCAGYTVSGSLHGDKMMTLMYFVTLAMQHKMVWIGMGVDGPATQSGHGGNPDDINRVGAYVGLMAQADNTDANQSPPDGDRKTAEGFGTRVAEAAKRWVRGGSS